MNPVTKQLPQPVTVVSINATPVQTVHLKDGQGYGSQGEKGGLIDVKKGKPVYDQQGQQAADIQEKKDVYKTYHVTDVNVAGIKPRTAPNDGKGRCAPSGRRVRQALHGSRRGASQAGQGRAYDAGRHLRDREDHR